MTEVTARIEMKSLAEQVDSAVGLRATLRRMEEEKSALTTLLNLERAKTHRLYATLRDVEKQCDQYRAIASSALDSMALDSFEHG